jgi:hypothetical protein
MRREGGTSVADASVVDFDADFVRAGREDFDVFDDEGSAGFPGDGGFAGDGLPSISILFGYDLAECRGNLPFLRYQTW